MSWGQTGLRAAEAAGLLPATPRAVIPASPPDPHVFRPVAPRPPDGTLRLCFVGRLVPLKGCDDLLLGVAGANESSRISVTFVGWGPQEATLRQLANDLRVKASFLGSLDSRAVHAVLADSDVLVAPSRNTPNCREQWGRVVVEAMISRRCVLVSDSGELPFLVGDPECVFPQNDPESLSKALDALTGDHPLVRKRAVAAYEQSQKFHPAVLAGQMLRVWSRSLDVWGTPRSR